MAEQLPGGTGPSLVIGIGASAGGVDALRAVVRQLPLELDAAVCVVLHLPAAGKSLLAPILDRAGPLLAAVAADGEPLQAGRIYVAPADSHLLVQNGHITLTRGPKENGTRPAVDPMLRTLAQHYGARSVAVILSGALGDGSAGAAAVSAVGGAVLVQDPGEAIVPSMPESALRAVGGRAAVLPGDEIGPALARLADESRAVREDVIAAADPPQTELVPAGAPTALSCPDCGGPLWDDEQGGVVGYRCRVGHAYSEDALIGAQATGVEVALWTAVEVLEERAELLRRVASHSDVRSGLEEGAADALRRSSLVRRALAQAREGTDALGLEPAGGVE